MLEARACGAGSSPLQPGHLGAPEPGHQRVHPLGDRLHAGELPDFVDRRHRGGRVTLAILGVPFALLLGIFVALVDLLPLVGGLLAGVPVVIIAAIHSVPAGIVMLVVFLAYQQVENHILNPIIMSRTVRLNPFWVLLAVLVGATLGGASALGWGRSSVRSSGFPSVAPCRWWSGRSAADPTRSKRSRPASSPPEEAHLLE
jgi:hypothetical protein